MEGEVEICREDDVVNAISKLYLESEFADLLFIVDGEKLPAHRSILAAGCGYFRGLLFGGFSESKEREIVLNEPLEGFKLVLKYIYTGKIDLAQSSDDVVIDLLHLTHKFTLKNVMSDVSESLEQRLSIINVFDVLAAASFHSLEKLEAAVLGFIDENAKELIEENHFNPLPKELMSKIISRNAFPVPEIDIFKLVMTWGKEKPEDDLKSVLSNVRFTLLQFYELSEIVEPSGVLEVAEIHNIIQEIKTVDKLPVRDAQLHRNQFSYFMLNNNNEMGASPAVGTYVMIELQSCAYVNCISMSFTKFCSYNIDVSRDKKDWHRVVTFEHFNCFGTQRLYFEVQSVRYVCVHLLKGAGSQIHSFKIDYNLRNMPVMIDGFAAANYGFGSTIGEIAENKSRTRQRIRLSQPVFVNCMYSESFFNNVVVKLESTLDYKNFKDLPVQTDVSNMYFFFDAHVVSEMRITYRNTAAPVPPANKIFCFFINNNSK